MSYGAAIDVPIVLEDPVVSSAYIPDMEELPRMAATSTQAIRLRDTLLKRLPSISSTDAQNLSMNSARAIEAEQLMQDIAVAHRITRMQNHVRDLIARDEVREIDRWLRSLETERQRQARAIQAATVQNRQRQVRHFARELLGVGTDLWK